MSHADIAIPQLPSRSLEKTCAFYRRLGFDAEIIGADYAILERGPLEVHFFLHRQLEPAASAFGCYLRVGDVAAMFEAFAAAGLPTRGIPRMDRLEDKPWGMKEFAVIDEDGNLLRIGQVSEKAA
jgi:catechol 2,3-dioxygenase-like lactoylglutathione lyase family enzyme